MPGRRPAGEGTRSRARLAPRSGRVRPDLGGARGSRRRHPACGHSARGAEAPGGPPPGGRGRRGELRFADGLHRRAEAEGRPGGAGAPARDRLRRSGRRPLHAPDPRRHAGGGRRPDSPRVSLAPGPEHRAGRRGKSRRPEVPARRGAAPRAPGGGALAEVRGDPLPGAHRRLARHARAPEDGGRRIARHDGARGAGPNRRPFGDRAPLPRAGPRGPLPAAGRLPDRGGRVPGESGDGGSEAPRPGGARHAERGAVPSIPAGLPGVRRPRPPGRCQPARPRLRRGDALRGARRASRPARPRGRDRRLPWFAPGGARSRVDPARGDRPPPCGRAVRRSMGPGSPCRAVGRRAHHGRAGGPRPARPGERGPGPGAPAAGRDLREGPSAPLPRFRGGEEPRSRVPAVPRRTGGRRAPGTAPRGDGTGSETPGLCRGLPAPRPRAVREAAGSPGSPGPRRMSCVRCFGPSAR